MSMELSNYLVSWVVTYLGDLQPTYIRVIIYLLSSMDIPERWVGYILSVPGISPTMQFVESREGFSDEILPVVTMAS